jgi:hypothetical protein
MSPRVGMNAMITITAARDGGGEFSTFDETYMEASRRMRRDGVTAEVALMPGAYTCNVVSTRGLATKVGRVGRGDGYAIPRPLARRPDPANDGDLDPAPLAPAPRGGHDRATGASHLRSNPAS